MIDKIAQIVRKASNLYHTFHAFFFTICAILSITSSINLIFRARLLRSYCKSCSQHSRIYTAKLVKRQVDAKQSSQPISKSYRKINLSHRNVILLKSTKFDLFIYFFSTQWHIMALHHSHHSVKPYAWKNLPCITSKNWCHAELILCSSIKYTQILKLLNLRIKNKM